MPAIIRAKTGIANNPSQLPQEQPKYIIEALKEDETENRAERRKSKRKKR